MTIKTTTQAEMAVYYDGSTGYNVAEIGVADLKATLDRFPDDATVALVIAKQSGGNTMHVTLTTETDRYRL